MKTITPQSLTGTKLTHRFLGSPLGFFIWKTVANKPSSETFQILRPVTSTHCPSIIVKELELQQLQYLCQGFETLKLGCLLLVKKSCCCQTKVIVARKVIVAGKKVIFVHQCKHSAAVSLHVPLPPPPAYLALQASNVAGYSAAYAVHVCSTVHTGRSTALP